MKVCKIYGFTALSVVLFMTSFVCSDQINTGDSRSYDIFGSEYENQISIQSTEELSQNISLPALRFRYVGINPVLSSIKILELGDKLNLAFFDDSVYAATVDKVTKNINGTVTVRARIDGYPLGYVLISTDNGRSTGTVKIPEENVEYAICFSNLSQSHYLIDIDVDAIEMLEGGDPLIPPIQPISNDEVLTTQDITSRNPLQPVNIDVMIVYTPSAKIWADANVGGINNCISQAMANAQLALDNSDTMLTLTLVYSGEVGYTESGNSYTDLDRLRDPVDGFMDNVAILRDQYGADLVSLFAQIDDVGGLGWLLTSLIGNRDYGFTIVRVQQAAGGYTYVHEVGHNMGCHHHKLQNYQEGPNLDLNTYSAGWRWIGNDGGRYCSVMTYESGTYFADGQAHTQVPYFSNPNVFHQGVPTGDSVDGDNARTLRETKFTVAAYKGSVMPGSGTPLDPYRISTIEHLEAVNDDLDAYYIVVNDIDLDGISYSKALIAPDMNPGNTNTWFVGVPFTGSFNGYGYKIKNLTILGNDDYLGLFGCVESGGYVSNVALESSNITGNMYVGGVAGSNWGNISKSFCAGYIYGAAHIGGVVGIGDGGGITNCYSIAILDADTDAGGLVGNNYGDISFCYSAGPVYTGGYYYFGGLVGWQSSRNGSVTSSYWDVENSGKPLSAAGTGQSTADMRTGTNFAGAGWSFAADWQMSTVDKKFDGYPIFKSQIETAALLSINPRTRQHDKTGGQGTIYSFDVESNISWIVEAGLSSWTPTVPWITVLTTSGTNGSVTYSVEENTGAPRTGAIIIRNSGDFGFIRVFWVNQESGYSLSITPNTGEHTPCGESGSFSVLAGDANDVVTWKATANEPWITITSGSFGSNNGDVIYDVLPNSTGSQRIGTITVSSTGIYAGITRTFTVDQDAATLFINPDSRNYSAGAGTGTIWVTSNISWEALSNDAWITINSGSSGSGNGLVNYTVSASSGGFRTGTITIRGYCGGNYIGLHETFTVNQDGAFLTIDPTFENIGAEGGNGSVSVYSNLSWSVASSAPWITITSGSGGSNYGTVTYHVSANTGYSPRTGTITVSGGGITRTLTVYQGVALKINPCHRTHAFGADTATISVESTNWTATVTEGNTWLTVTAGGTGSGNGLIEYSLEQNTNEARVGIITISGGGLTLEFTVYQRSKLDYILIVGDSVVSENTINNYSCMAYYTDGSIADVTSSAVWAEDSNYATINSDGRLRTFHVKEDKAVNLVAGYTEGTISKTDQRLLTIENISVENNYSGGIGTASYPYKISTVADWEDLMVTPDDWDKHFILINDLDLSGVTLSPVGLGYFGESPSMNLQGIPFNGVFDGQKNQVKNPRIISEQSGFAGLFQIVAPGATIKNLGVVNVTVKAGDVNYSDGSVSWGVGCLAGVNFGTIINCYSGIGTAEGNYSVGGLIGENLGVIANSYAAVDVTAENYVGGLVGRNTGKITNSYSVGNLSGTDFTGGLVGENWGINAVVLNCYSIGDVSPLGVGVYVGGLAGRNYYGKITSSYWDTETSGQIPLIETGLGKTTAQMRDINTFLDGGWDFAGEAVNGMMDLWYMVGRSYPKLNWQPAGDINLDGAVDGADLQILLQNWLGTGVGVPGDINGDGIVDLLDCAIIANDWLE